ncbi:MAG: beta-propeller fold lactonase family protein [Proteobacteria bacterium]|nr:beta-propeller fold lactonase family protein [Pseudomonadota bacterium]
MKHIILAMNLLLSFCFVQETYSKTAVIPNQGEDTVILFDIDKGEKLVVLNVNKAPVGIALDEKSEFAYVTHPEVGKISEIDIEQKKVVREYDVGGQPFGIVVYEDWRRLLFVTDWSRDALLVIDAQQGLIIDLLAVGTAPAGIAIDETNKRIYVVNREDNTLSVLDLERPKQYALLKTGKGPYSLALSPDNKILFVASVQDDTLIAFDTSTLKERKRIKTGGHPYAISVSPDMSNVVVSNQRDNNISVYSYPDLLEKKHISVGKSPEAVGFIDDHTVLVTNWFSNDWSIVDLGAGKETKRIPAGEGTRAFGLFVTRK